MFFEDQIIEHVCAILKCEKDDVSALTAPPKADLGDCCLPLFTTAKKLRCAPATLATTLAESVWPPYIARATAMGPYLNLVYDPAWVFEGLACSTKKTEPQHFLIEHTSINPNASPHIGRTRNALIGDTLCRMLRSLGHTVETHYYVNDMGKQIALLVHANQGQTPRFEKMLALYVEAHQALKTDPTLEPTLFKLLQQFEAGDHATRHAFRAIVECCLAGQRAILEQLGITFDHFDYESDYLHDPALEKKLQEVEQALFIDEDGRQVADLAQLGFQQKEGRFFVLKRGNGTTMYGYRDLAYTMMKLQRTHNTLAVMGEDHTLYCRQIATFMQAFGLPPQHTIHYAFIRLRSGTMSTREGTVVLVEDLLKEATEKALALIATDKLSTSARHSAAKAIAVGAIRYALLKIQPTSPITFDIDQALSFEGDTGPYIQYTYVRLQAILAKFSTPECPPKSAVSPSIKEVLLLAVQWPTILQKGCVRSNPALIAQYALDLAKAANRFYHHHPIARAKDSVQQALGLHTCAKVTQLLAQVCHTLGIPLPEAM